MRCPLFARRAVAVAALAALSVLPVLSGCGNEEGPAPVSGPLQGELSVDIRESASVTLTENGPAIEVALKLSKGYGVATAGAEIKGSGRAEPLPEAGVTLYTARVDGAPEPSGPCGAEPISLALSLHRRGDAPRVSGALTAYCGKDVWHGKPARLLRLAGDLKR